jgi:hypothetical protein
METKISKAQIEVWDWKESLYEELRNIPKSERLNYIRQKVSNTINKIKRKKARVA